MQIILVTKEGKVFKKSYKSRTLDEKITRLFPHFIMLAFIFIVAQIIRVVI